MLSEDQGSQNFVLQKPQEATNHRWELVMKLQNKSSFKIKANILLKIFYQIRN